MAVRKIEHRTSPPGLRIALVVAALLIAGVASLYMVQTPGALSSMLGSLWPF